MDQDNTQPPKPELDVTALSTPKLIDHLSQMFVEYATPLLNTAFNKVDDSLFDQADRSTSNTQQQVYFETMRAVRVSRSDIVNHFFALFKKGWRPVKAPPLLTGKVSFDELSLLRKDELEELVANEAMITRIREQAGDQLDFLIQRCQTLNKHLDSEEVPFHPKFLCQSFGNAITKVELDINSKIIVLKHFDRHVISNLIDCYSDLNHTLVQAGILPELKSKKPRNQGRDGKSQNSENEHYQGGPNAGPYPHGSFLHAGGAGFYPGGIQNFDELRGLIQQSSQGPNGQGIANQNFLGPVGGVAAGSSNGIAGSFIPSANGSASQSGQPVIMASNELAATLGQIQTQMGQENGQSVAIGDVKAALKVKLEDRSLNQVDNDALNLVSMLFEFILDDPQLSVHMKELFGRLQIPMLKVAVLDNGFFSNKKHPARLLLNGLARAGQAWNPKEKLAEDKYFQIVAKIVRKVVEDFTDDIKLFTQLNVTLNKLLDHQKQQQEKRQQAIKLKEEEKARTELAHKQASETIADLCERFEPPAFLQQFLKNNWIKVFEASLLQGDTNMYHHANDLAETLIWSTDPKEIIQDRKTFLRKAPVLLADIRQIALAYQFPQTDVNALMDNLEHIHLHQSRLSLEELSQLEAQKEQDKAATNLLAESLDAFHPITGDMDSNSEQSDHTTNMDTVSGYGADNVIPLKAKTAEPISRADQEYYDLIKKFEVGMLFEIHSEKETEKGSEKDVQRKNLTAIISSTEKYIFMDRHGGNRTELLVDELALALEEGRVRHLDDSLLFDRALEAVIGSLRKNRSA